MCRDMDFLLFLILATVCVNNVILVAGAKILGVVPTPAISHQIVFQPLWRELSLRGHQVVVLTTDPMRNASLTNLTEIDLHSSYKIWDAIMGSTLAKPKGFGEMMKLTIAATNKVIDYQLSQPKVKEILEDENANFDLVITEIVIPIAVLFSEKLKCPYIGVVSFDAPNYFYSTVGNHMHPIANPDVNLPFVDKLSFLQRLQSALYLVALMLLKPFFVKDGDVIMKRHFGDAVDLGDVLNKMSLLFVNVNPVLKQQRPLNPNVIQIGGGIHRQSNLQLPKNLQILLDGASQGFIYFSLGSNVKSKYLKDDIKMIIRETFRELPYLILWKFELEGLREKPDNVFISDWFPQQAIFRHPNIKLFITQGGAQSVEEAIYESIPMLGIPFFMDQSSNVKQMVSRGLGLSLDYKALNRTSFMETILEIINNPKYLHNARKFTNLVNDQSMMGLEKAIWWTEYVLRHKGAKHLKSPALDLPMYQYYMVDVLSFYFSVFVLVLLVLKMIVKYSYARVRNFLAA